jgi:hypothetical protein
MRRMSSFFPFKFIITLNLLIIGYSVYQVKSYDSQWWGYNGIGVFLWTVTMILTKPSSDASQQFKLDKFFDYPALALIVFLIALHTAGDIGKLIIWGFFVSIIAVIITHHLKKNIKQRLIVSYYAGLILLCWSFLYKYILVSVAYTLFALYCWMNVQDILNRAGKTQLSKVTYEK